MHFKRIPHQTFLRFRCVHYYTPSCLYIYEQRCHLLSDGSALLVRDREVLVRVWSRLAPERRPLGLSCDGRLERGGAGE